MERGFPHCSHCHKRQAVKMTHHFGQGRFLSTLPPNSSPDDASGAPAGSRPVTVWKSDRGEAGWIHRFSPGPDSAAWVKRPVNTSLTRPVRADFAPCPRTLLTLRLRVFLRAFVTGLAVVDGHELGLNTAMIIKIQKRRFSSLKGRGAPR